MADSETFVAEEILIKVEETNAGKAWSRETRQYRGIPRRIECHNPRCSTGEGFRIDEVVKDMIEKGETEREGGEACHSPKHGRGIDCVNTFKYTVTIRYKQKA
jgi:hypothetical protein